MKKSKEEIAELFEEHQAYIKRIVGSFLKRYPSYYYLVDDLVGACNLKFLRIVKKFDEDAGVQFTSFLWDQLWYYCLKEIEKETKIHEGERLYAEEEVHLRDDTYDLPYFETLLEKGDCTPGQAEVLRCRFIAGMTYDEIAEVLGVTKQAVYNQEQRALRKMRDRV